MGQRRSLIHAYPDHTVEFSPNPEPVVVEFGGERIAQSTRSVFLAEADYPPVLYLPIEDVRQDLISATDHHTFCPFKGEASYWTIQTGNASAENAIWGYPDPFEEVGWLKGLVAFYADRVEMRIGHD